MYGLKPTDLGSGLKSGTARLKPGTARLKSGTAE